MNRFFKWFDDRYDSNNTDHIFLVGGAMLVGTLALFYLVAFPLLYSIFHP